jgi:hypothetical protein
LDTTEGPLAHDVDELKSQGGPGRTFAFAEIKSGRLKAKKMGRRTIVLRSDLLSYLEALPAARGGEIS